MIEINNLTRFKISANHLKKIAEKILSGEKEEKFDLSFAFIGKEKIQKLNRKYRKKNSPTDVISFTYRGSGEIIICPQMIEDNAKKFRENFKEELYRVFIHGILHTLGYEHEKNKAKAQKMEKKTNYYLKLFTKK